MWGRLSLAGLLLAGCAFDPRGSSSSTPDADAARASDARPEGDGSPDPIDAAPPTPDSAPVEPVLLETLIIDAAETDAIQSTVVLQTGSSYRLVASGVVDIRDNDYSGDADYWWPDDLPGLISDSAGGVDLGLAINDTTIDGNRSPNWGDFADSHVYETTMAGTGSTLTAQFHDPNYDNNSGSMTLEIWGPP